MRELVCSPASVFPQSVRPVCLQLVTAAESSIRSKHQNTPKRTIVVLTGRITTDDDSHNQQQIRREQHRRRFLPPLLLLHQFFCLFLMRCRQNLVVTLDCHCLTTKNHIPNLVRLANFELHRIGPIRYFLSVHRCHDFTVKTSQANMVLNVHRNRKDY